jgi:ADP-ribose pyrophosphatase
MTDQDIEILVRETPFKGFFRMDRYRLRHRKFDGTWTGVMQREIFVRDDAVGILLYDPVQDSVVMVEQFRLPAHLVGRNAWALEIPAGIIGQGESLEEVARREVQEETGCQVVGELKKICDFMPSIGGSAEKVTLYCARVDAPDPGGLHGVEDEHEDIRVVIMMRTDAIRLVDDNQLDNGAAVIALHWLARHWEELRREWLGDVAPA